MTTSVRTFLAFLIISFAGGCTERLPVNVQIYVKLFASLDAADMPLYIREAPARLSIDEVPERMRKLFSAFQFTDSNRPHQEGDFGSLHVRLISEAEFSRMFVGGCERGWDQFHNKYPEAKSLLQVSLVGFRSNKSEALVYVAGGSECLAGSGYLFLLQKGMGGWNVVQEFNLWVA